MKKRLLQFVLAICMMDTASAQNSTSPSAMFQPPPPHVPNVASNSNALTPADWQELRIAKQAALKANPNLVMESEQLTQKMRAFQEKLDAAIIKEDPTVAPIISKLEASRPKPKIINPPQSK
jgi:hypothetical protein